jgi:DnaJ-class molecular chaperone
MDMQDTKLVDCAACKGQGTIRDPKTSRAEKCTRCDGKGVISIPAK